MTYSSVRRQHAERLPLCAESISSTGILSGEKDAAKEAVETGLERSSDGKKSHQTSAVMNSETLRSGRG